MELNDKQLKMLEKMMEWDDEYWYPYYYFDDIYDKKTLQKEMKGLVSSGLVKICRGGLNDDGEVAGGCGFGIVYGKRREVENLLIKNQLISPLVVY